MKKIKCQLCGGVWIVEDDNLAKQKVCPYCETSIREKVEFDSYDSLDKAIYGAVLKMGNEAFQNFHQLSDFILDIAPNLNKEVRIFSKTVTDDYAIYIRTLFEQDMDEAEKTTKRMKKLFIEEEGLSEMWADKICEALYGAAKYYNSYRNMKMKNVTVEDTLISNSDLSSTYSDNYHKTKDMAQNREYDRTDYTSEDISEQHTYSSSIIKNTYNEENFRTILENAKKLLSEKNTDAALEEYKRAANGGFVPAYNLIASIYYSKRNYKKAWKWYLKAAGANDSEGQYHVGLFYQNGLHVEKNVHMAIKYFEKSSKQNNENALLALVDLYQQAASRGDSEAKNRLEECVSKMTLSQKIKWKLH